MYVYIYICIYIDIHTYTHTHAITECVLLTLDGKCSCIAAVIGAGGCMLYAHASVTALTSLCEAGIALGAEPCGAPAASSSAATSAAASPSAVESKRWYPLSTP